MKQQRIIYLIGYRGSGKTSLASKLADVLGWQALDADPLLEARFGKSIRTIFAEQGEPAFRDMEAKVLADLAQAENCVVATGGGVILREDNRQHLRRGLVVWLRAPSEVLFERMRQDASTAERRPDLARGGLAEVEQMLQQRDPIYARLADIVVDTHGLSPDQILENLRQHPVLGQFLASN